MSWQNMSQSLWQKENPCVTSKFSIKCEMSKIRRCYGYFAAWGSHEKKANIKPAPFREQAIWSYKNSRTTADRKIGDLSVKLLPGHLVLRFIHCHVAMARCSVLTVHIQSALHPIFMKLMLTWLEWKGWAITFPGNASILCGWIQCSRRSFDKVLSCTWGKTASVP